MSIRAKITIALQLLVLTAVCNRLHAGVTVESYQNDMAKPDSVSAGFDKAYIWGVGNAMQFANLAMYAHVQDALHLPPKQLIVTKMFCAPEKLVLELDNYISILNAEIKRRLVQAGGDSSEIKKVMQTPIEVVLLYGMESTFPCAVP